MKERSSKASQSGFTLFEILFASGITIAIGALSLMLITQQQRGASAELNRQSAKIVSRTASQNIKQLFRQAEGIMSISGGDIFLGPDATSPNYASVKNTCITLSAGAAFAAPSFSLPSDCPAPCPAGQVPQIQVTHKVAGVDSTRLFPTSFNDLYGAIACAKEFAPLLTFPVVLRAPNYSIMIYTGWKTLKSGTSAAVLWSVDGSFLTGGNSQNVVMKSHE